MLPLLSVRHRPPSLPIQKRLPLVAEKRTTWVSWWTRWEEPQVEVSAVKVVPLLVERKMRIEPTTRVLLEVGETDSVRL